MINYKKGLHLPSENLTFAEARVDEKETHLR